VFVNFQKRLGFEDGTGHFETLGHDPAVAGAD
jgi:hypothetical protein